MSLEELAAIKIPTVYGASRYEQSAAEAPASITVITREDIQRFGYRTLAEIMSGVRGFYVTSDRGYSYIGSRGFNRLNDYGGRMLLMVDGHRLNDPIYDTAAADVDFLVDVDLIERVEIIRGPGASIYGNNAFLRAINVVTRPGRDIGGAEVSGSYGTFDTWTGRATFGERFANGVELMLSGSWLESAGASRLNFPEFTAENLDGGWARRASAQLSFGDFRLNGGFVRRQKDWPTAAYDTIPNSQTARLASVDERAFVEASHAKDWDDGWSSTARVYYDLYRFGGFYPYDYDANPLTAPTLNIDRARAASVGTDVAISKEWETHHLSAGVEFRGDFQLRQANYDIDPYLANFDNERAEENFGIYLQDEWRWSSNLIFNVGGRYDYFSTFGSEVSPRAAVIVMPADSSVVKFLFGRAFRAPNAYERQYQAFGLQPNPALAPEIIHSYELVWDQNLSAHWRLSASAFWNQIDDLISEQFNPGPDLISPADDFYNFANVESAAVYGAEFEIEGQLAAGINLLASYTWADAKDRVTGRRLENSPPHLGKLRFSVPVWREKLEAGLEVQAVSGMETLGGQRTGAYAVVNVTFLSREVLPGLEVSVSVYNLFDVHYRQPGSADFSYIGPISGNALNLDSIEQDGRSFRLKATWKF